MEAKVERANMLIYIFTEMRNSFPETHFQFATYARMQRKPKEAHEISLS